MPVYIYGLIDPDTKELRYIGKTVNPTSRLISHCHATDQSLNRRRVGWILGLKAAGKKPIMEILEECTENTWEESERKWIEKYKSSPGLTNVFMGHKGKKIE